jgi:YbbR domain-containing protein
MSSLLKRLGRSISTLLLAFALAVIVWVYAVTSADPTEDRIYPRSIPIELINQASDLVITSNMPSQVSVTLRAPKSIWDRLINSTTAVRAYVDLSKVSAGQYPLLVQIEIAPEFEFVREVTYSPRTINLTLEKYVKREFPITLVTRGEPAVGFQTETPKLSQETVSVSGSEALVNRVAAIKATLDLNQTEVSLDRTLALQAYGSNDALINGLKIDPSQIVVNQPIKQRRGYRNLVVKVMTKGQIANGYRLTNISAFPQSVTVYSTDTNLIADLPGYVETEYLDVSGAKDDIDVHLLLALPAGVSVDGGDTIEVQVGIAAIESSVTFTNMKVVVVGLKPGLVVKISPEVVDVILSGPLPVLDRLNARDVQVVIDLTDDVPGKYQRAPKVILTVTDLRVESIIPESVEINISEPTPTPSPTIGTETVTVVPMPFGSTTPTVRETTPVNKPTPTPKP